jgi:hypothetical protein
MARDQAHDPTIRISDADRQVVATALAKNAAEGRLTLEELEERLGTVYAAKTYGDINSLLSDLPRGGASPLVLAGDRLPADRPPGRSRRRRRSGWSSYTTVNALCWAIWGVAAVMSPHYNLRHVQDMWPLWVTVPWGVIRLSRRSHRPGPAQPAAPEG